MVLVIAVLVFAILSGLYARWEYRSEQRFRRDNGMLYDPDAVD